MLLKQPVVFEEKSIVQAHFDVREAGMASAVMVEECSEIEEHFRAHHAAEEEKNC